MKSYNILAQMSKIKGIPSRAPSNNPFANGRVLFIRNYLRSNGIRFVMDCFTTQDARTAKFDDDQLKYVNFYMNSKALLSKTPITVFIAHHDINNVDSQNVVDNTASVCNILDLAGRLGGKTNVLLAITDAEEIVSLTDSGAKRLVRLLKYYKTPVKEVVNLELTAFGRGRVKDHPSKVVDDSFNLVHAPFNDSTVFRAFGIPSVCINIIPEEEIIDVLTKGHCETWGLCHSRRDVFDNANAEDMDILVNYLMSVV
jgi:hypothetical protein